MRKTNKETAVIRHALAEDVEPTYRVLERGFRSLLEQGYSSRAVEEAITHPGELYQHIVKGDHALVAELEGRIIGTITGVDEEGRMSILSLAVAPAYRRRGVGRRLMRELEAIAQRQGLQRLQLEVASAMTQAVQLLESLGYQRENCRKGVLCGEMILFSKSLGEKDGG